MSALFSTSPKINRTFFWASFCMIPIIFAALSIWGYFKDGQGDSPLALLGVIPASAIIALPISLPLILYVNLIKDQLLSILVGSTLFILIIGSFIYGTFIDNNSTAGLWIFAPALYGTPIVILSWGIDRFLRRVD